MEWLELEREYEKWLESQDCVSSIEDFYDEFADFCDYTVRKGFEDVDEIAEIWIEEKEIPKKFAEIIHSQVEEYISCMWDFPHSPADFRALREQLGITRPFLADILSVKTRAIKRWEEPEAEFIAPIEAWTFLDACERRQIKMISEALEIINESVEKYGEPGLIKLPYWVDEEEYVAAGKDNDFFNWEMANATSRLLAIEIKKLGYDVSFDYDPIFPEDTDI